MEWVATTGAGSWADTYRDTGGGLVWALVRSDDAAAMEVPAARVTARQCVRAIIRPLPLFHTQFSLARLRHDVLRYRGGGGSMILALYCAANSVKVEAHTSSMVRSAGSTGICMSRARSKRR